MKKQKLICPNCRERGKTEVLGEFDKDGNFYIKRYHKGATKIVSREFAVECGVCGEVVFIRRNNDSTKD